MSSISITFIAEMLCLLWVYVYIYVRVCVHNYVHSCVHVYHNNIMECVGSCLCMYAYYPEFRDER